MHAMGLVSDGLVLNFDNVNSEQLQSTRELEAMNLLDLSDSNEIQLDNFLPEQESSNVQSDLIDSSQRDSGDAKSTEFSANPTGSFALPHLISFDEPPEI